MKLRLNYHLLFAVQSSYRLGGNESERLEKCRTSILFLWEPSVKKTIHNVISNAWQLSIVSFVCISFGVCLFYLFFPPAPDRVTAST